MAKQNPTRRKAARPRRQGLTVRGVRLTATQADEYRTHLAARYRTNAGDSPEQIECLALDDTLSKYRASTNAKAQLLGIYRDMSATALAAASLGDWQFRKASMGRLQLGTLASLADQAKEQAARLRRLQQALRQEYREHARQQT